MVHRSRSATVTPTTSRVLMPQGSPRLRLSGPQMAVTTLFSTNRSPIVTMISAAGGWPTNHRRTDASVSTPTSAPAAIAITKER